MLLLMMDTHLKLFLISVGASDLGLAHVTHHQDLESWFFLSYSDTSLGFVDDIVLVLVEVWLPYVLTFFTF